MKIEIISTAMDDLRDIYNYISNVLNNPIAAERIIKNVRQAFLSISNMPFIGQSLNNKINTDTSFRFFTCGNYLIFYLVEENHVAIHRIIYGKRDYAKILFKANFNADDKDIDS